MSTTTSTPSDGKEPELTQSEQTSPFYMPLRWDEMAVGTCPATIPWGAQWSDTVAALKSKNIERLLAWGDSTGRGKCRFESADRDTPLNGKEHERLARRALAIARGIAMPFAKHHAEWFVRDESFFSRGRRRCDFNMSIDLRDGIDIRLILHATAACGLVYMLTVSPVPTPRSEPVGDRKSTRRTPVTL